MHVRDLFDLRGRAALVTGGGRGLGRAIALGLAEAGARVAVASRKLDACRAVAEEIRGAGGEGLALRADLGRLEEVERLAEAVREQIGWPDVLVNNAGTVWAAPSFDHPIEGWDRVFAVNVRGAWELTRRLAVGMRERGRGSVVFVSSTAAFVGGEEAEQPAVGYAASKGALVSLVRDLAVKWGPLGIRVNAIAPGPFATDMFRHVSDRPERLEAFRAGLPLRRIGGPDDVKGVAVFLASDAAAFVTGQTLLVDGGLVCLARA